MTDKQTKHKKSDWPWTLLALVCAVMLWFYAEAEKNPLMDMQFDVPVEYINQSEEFVVEPAVQSVRVTVKGKEVELSGLRSDDFTAVVDLSKAEIGKQDYKIEVTSSGKAERFTYLPTKTTLQIDRMQTKEVPVRVRTTGTVTGDSQVASTEVVPNTVIIAGLESQLDKITDIETEVINIGDLTEDTIIEAGLQLPDGIQLKGTQTVQVHFLMQEEQRHMNTLISVYHVPDGMNAELNRTAADVTISGSSGLGNNEAELKRVKLYVDCTGLGAGQHTLPVQVEYDGSLVIGQVRPQTVSVTITEIQQNGSHNSNEEKNETTH